MSQNVHIEHIGDTLSNVWSNADVHQSAILTDYSDFWTWKNSDNTRLYVAATQKYTLNGSTWTYMGADFGTVTIRDNAGLYVAQDIIHHGDDDTMIRFTSNKISTLAGNIAIFTLDGSASPAAITMNNGSANVDFVVKGQTDSALLFVDGSADTVGVGCGAQLGKFQVRDGSTSGVTPNVNADAVFIEGDVDTGISLGAPLSCTTSLMFATPDTNYAGRVQYYNLDNVMSLTAATTMMFRTDETERLRITEAGNVDVKTAGACLGVPVKTTTGDPTGYEGALYLNTEDNVLRIYADGSWRTVLSY